MAATSTTRTVIWAKAGPGLLKTKACVYASYMTRLVLPAGAAPGEDLHGHEQQEVRHGGGDEDEAQLPADHRRDDRDEAPPPAGAVDGGGLDQLDRHVLMPAMRNIIQ